MYIYDNTELDNRFIYNAPNWILHTDNLNITINTEDYNVTIIITIDGIEQTNLNQRCGNLEEAIIFSNEIINQIDSDWNITYNNLINYR